MAGASPDHGQKPESSYEFAQQLRWTRPNVCRSRKDP